MEDNNPIQNPTPQPIIPPAPEPVVQTPSEPLSEPKTRLSKWILVAIVAVVLIIVGGASAYVLNNNSIKTAKTLPSPTSRTSVTATPTADPTANWKTLTSNVCGISLKYPQDWEGNLTESNGCLFQIKNPAVQKQIFTLLSPSATWPSILQENKDGKTITIGGTQPLEVQTDGLHGFYFRKNGLVYNIVYFFPLNDQNTETIYNKIVSSIKFMDQSIDASAWKTYAGNGFSLKYPPSWTIEELPQDVKNLNSIFLEEDSTHAATLAFSTYKFPSVYPEYINNPNNPKITINGYDAYNDTGIFGKGAFYIVNLNQQFINISPGTIFDKGLFDKILSTFKFTQ